MYLVMAIHKPFPGKEEPLIDSMHRFGAAAKTQPGLQQVHTLKDKISGALVGLAMWDSAESAQAARPALAEAIKDDPFDEWEPEDPQILILEEV